MIYVVTFDQYDELAQVEFASSDYGNCLAFCEGFISMFPGFDGEAPYWYTVDGRILRIHEVNGA